MQFRDGSLELFEGELANEMPDGRPVQKAWIDDIPQKQLNADFREGLIQ